MGQRLESSHQQALGFLVGTRFTGGGLATLQHAVPVHIMPVRNSQGERRAMNGSAPKLPVPPHSHIQTKVPASQGLPRLVRTKEAPVPGKVAQPSCVASTELGRNLRQTGAPKGVAARGLRVRPVALHRDTASCQSQTGLRG